MLYGVSTGTDNLYTINPTTGAATLVTGISESVSLTGASFLGGDLFACDVFGGGGLYIGTVNITTGVYTGVGDQDGSINWHGLASDESAGLLYSIDIDDGNKLKSMTPTGTITTIGTGAGIGGRGMAYDDANDILYATGGGSLYTVSTSGGAATLIGAMGLGITGNRIGLAYDEDTNTLYANSGDTQSLYTLNVGTGAAVLVGLNNVGNAVVDGLAWYSGPDVIPEPTTLALLGLGLAAVARRRRRK